MKRQIKFLLAGLALASVGLISAPAWANDYNDNCANYPGSFDGTGNVTITDGACTIGNVTAAGNISITVSSLNAGAIDAGGTLTISSTGAVTSSDLSSQGALSVTGTSVDTGNLTTGYDEITIHATSSDIDVGTITSGYQVTATADSGDITTDTIDSPYAVTLSAPDGKITADDITTQYDIVDIESGDDIGLQQVTSGSYVKIIASSGDIQADDSIKAAYSIKVEADDGTIKLDTVTSNTSDQNGNILLVASENIQTKDIASTGTTGYGAIEIRANTGGGGDEFIIGGSGNSNGVNGSIDTTNTSGGGSDPGFIHGGVFIINGTTGAGGITLTDVSNIRVNATAGRSGIIDFDAKDGNITLPSGTLQSDGAAGFGAGAITMVAHEIHFADNSIVSASQDSGADGTNHGVILAANSLTFGGSSGLELHGDGDGDSQYSNGTVELYPEGSVTLSSNSTTGGDTYQYLYWSETIPSISTTSGTLNLTGSGNAPLTVAADGNNTSVTISGYPVNFTGGALNIHSRGGENHQVTIAYYGSLSGASGLSLTGTGDVNIDANGQDGDGGSVSIYVDHANVTSPNFNVQANGPSSGDGDGGKVFIQSSNLTIGSSTKSSIQANAASSGFGGAVYGDPTIFAPMAIEFFPHNDISLGTGDGQYNFSANGGSTGGAAGTIYIVPTGDVAITDQQVVTASGLAGDSNGGWIYIAAYITSATIDNISTPWALVAQGHGSGTGGKVFAYHSVQNLMVNNLINVNGGSSLLTAVDNDYGQVELNNVTCQQRTTGSSLMKTYWNCAHPTSSTTNETDMANAIAGLPTTFKTTLDSNNTQVYVTANNSDYNYFFDQSPAVTGGLGVTNVSYQRSTVWESTGSGIDYSPYLRGNVMHELGHLIDGYNGDLSKQVAFTGPDGMDIANMTAQSCATVFAHPAFCAAYPTAMNAWDTWYQAFISPQDIDRELFAQSFQVCSGFRIQNPDEDYAQRTPTPSTSYLSNIWSYQNTFWTGGCRALSTTP